MLASLWLTLSMHGISLKGRLTLMLLRLAAVGILLLGWLRPGFISTTERDSPGAIAVLMDRSQSMTLPSDSARQSRWEMQQEVWKAIVSQTNLEIGGTKIVPYFYDALPAAAKPDDLPSLADAFRAPPEGRLTDLGRTLSEIGRLQLDPPLRAVILMGDATQTLIPAEVDASVVAGQMARLDQPIMLVGIGPQQEKSLIRDLSIEGMPERFSAFIKKELNVRLVANIQGMQNEPIVVSLKMRSGGQEQIVASRIVQASSGNEKMPLDFRIIVANEGEYLLEATAELQDRDSREQFKANNTVQSFVSVREGGVKILYLYGQPLFEQKFLRRSLDESLDFEVEYKWFEERLAKRGPINFPQASNLNEYDVIILHDVDASAISRSDQQRIARRVRAGSGILFMGGYHSFDAGGYANSDLRNLFPVELNRRGQAFDRPIDQDLHITGTVRLIPTRPHPITTLLPTEPDNGNLWKKLTLEGANRLGPLTAAPGVQRLLESQNGDSLLVTGDFGNGRVLAFAGDTTYLWWGEGFKKAHQQFWRQAILWLVQRESLQEGFRLDMDRRRLLIDETPDLAIEWFGGSDNKPVPKDVNIELFRDGERLQRLPTRNAGQPLQSATINGLSKPGLYKAVLTSGGDGGTEYRSELAFIVRDESRELSRPAADWQMMNNIVSANRAAGGRLIRPDEISDAIDFLSTRQEATRVTTIEKRRLGDAAWDAWLYLVAFCIFMSVEWALRKAWQLP